MAKIIEQLKSARLLRGIKQAELGKKLGLPQSHVSKIESDQTDARLSTITDMARMLDHEIMLIPRVMVPQVKALLYGEMQERRWQPDEEVQS